MANAGSTLGASNETSGQITGRYTDASSFDHGIIAQLVNGGASVVLPLAPESEQVRALPQHPANTYPAY